MGIKTKYVTFLCRVLHHLVREQEVTSDDQNTEYDQYRVTYNVFFIYMLIKRYKPYKWFLTEFKSQIQYRLSLVTDLKLGSTASIW